PLRPAASDVRAVDRSVAARRRRRPRVSTVPHLMLAADPATMIADTPTGAIAVIVNARAGTAVGRPNLATELVDVFRAAGREIEVIALGDGDDPSTAARTASRHAAIVVAAGGDGTVSSVASAVVDS